LLKKKLLIAVLAVLPTYAVAELVYSHLHRRGVVSPYTLWFHELSDPKGNIRFSKEIGIQLSPRPSRIGVWNSEHGWICKSRFAGNNMGFSDPKDFVSRKRDADTMRVLVLGDSFTSSLYLNRAWPEVVEQNLRGLPLEIYNLAIDGVGLGNWAMVLENIVAKKGIEADLVVFALCCDDLDRSPSWWDDLPTPLTAKVGNPRITRTGSYDLAGFPRTEQAEHLDLDRWLLARPALFSQYWDAGQPLPYERPGGWRLWEAIRGAGEEEPPPAAWDSDPVRQQIVRDMAGLLKEHGMKARVVEVHGPARHMAPFARLLGVPEADIVRAAGMMDPARKHLNYIPDDGHFTEAGARALGDALTPHFRSWYQQWAREQAK